MPGRTTDDIKAKLSIVDVISPYVKLTKAGRYYKGLSPFTNEKTPSFFVSPDRGSYYCFSSNKGGDVFTFIQEMEGVDFKGALKILAEKAGVPLVYERGEDRKEHDDLYKAVALAEQFYRQQMTPAAKEYAEGRGINDESMRAWGIGYAPDEWRTFLTYATEKGVNVKTLLAAGLIKEAEGKKGTYYDRFRNRLLFPIRDAAGRTVAFSGRTLSTEADVAKYLNSPETPLFKKSEILYGIDKAKQAIRTRGYALIVEGQMDLVLMHQSGFENTVALSGTAFTDVQLGLLKRFADKLMFALDSDRAGIASMEKSAALALSKGMQVKVVVLPDGEDPADIITKDAKKMPVLVKDAVHVIPFLTSYLLGHTTSEQAAFTEVEARVLPLVRAVQSPLEREHFIRTVSEMLEVPSAVVHEALKRVGGGEVLSKEIHNPQKEAAGLKRIEIIMALAELYPELKEHIHGELKDILQKVGEVSISERTRFEVEEVFGEKPKEEDVLLTIKECKREYVKQELSRVSAELKQAERAKKSDAVDRLSEEIGRLTKELATLS